MKAETTFSDELEQWIKSPGTKTIGDLLDVFDERAFAMCFLVLLAPSALPIPTGGVTHVLEIIAIVLALELIVGRRTPLLPRRWMRRPLGPTSQKKSIPRLIKLVRWFERFAHGRGARLFDHRLAHRLLGLGVLIGTLGALVAPPFSGLDTLPSLGVVVMSLGLILTDALIALVGVLIGAVGIALIFTLGSAVFSLFT